MMVALLIASRLIYSNIILYSAPRGTSTQGFLILPLTGFWILYDLVCIDKQIANMVMQSFPPKSDLFFSLWFVWCR